MHTLAVVRTSAGELVALGHGALIGRLWSADLSLPDPRVSEAHAMVSLRGRDLHLLALRGRLIVDGRSLTGVILSAGQKVSLAPGVELEVVEVRVPDAVLALEADGLQRQVPSGVTSLFGGAAPRLLAGWHPGADDYVWPDGEAWMRGTGAPVPLAEHDAWDVGGTTFRAVLLRTEGAAPTKADPAYASPLTIVARWDTVHLRRDGEPTVVVTGHMARAISEIALAGTALSWTELARLKWPEGDRDLLRGRWDMQMRRLRLKLATHGIRTDLVRADGSGLIELVLTERDRVVDET